MGYLFPCIPSLIYLVASFSAPPFIARAPSRYYDPIVKKASDNLLGVPAIVLANLCVSRIMTSQNEEAEELMRKIEKVFEAH